jgi:pantetheine-phosphate adenylyltransferase
MARNSVAIYPGSFDPITNGHLHLIRRGLKVFDKIIVGIAHNVRKQTLFTVDERLELIRTAVKENPKIDEKRVTTDAFEGLLVEYARKVGAHVVIRGLRAVSDFEFEFQMANMNYKLYPEMDTFFMMTGLDYFFISSGNIKEVVQFGGDVEGLVPPNVLTALKKKFQK